MKIEPLFVAFLLFGCAVARVGSVKVVAYPPYRLQSDGKIAQAVFPYTEVVPVSEQPTTKPKVYSRADDKCTSGACSVSTRAPAIFGFVR